MLAFQLQGWDKEWILACMFPLVTEREIKQPRALLIAKLQTRYNYMMSL